MSLEQIGRFLIIVAVVLAVTGLAVYLIGKGLGIGRLPGDIVINRGPWRIFIPIATMILVSIILTVIVNVVLWLLRR